MIPTKELDKKLDNGEDITSI